MLFDCLGIGVGLWASVAATWKPDGRFTFGYSRVETLSGFANGACMPEFSGEDSHLALIGITGLFLILISIFIIFEAIQRMWVCAPGLRMRFFLRTDIVQYGSARDADSAVVTCIEHRPGNQSVRDVGDRRSSSPWSFAWSRSLSWSRSFSWSHTRTRQEGEFKY